MPYPISRRTVLRGLGAADALPWLEAMTPRSLADGAGAIEPPRRMIFCYVPNGMHMPEWTPGEEGELGTLPPILQPLDAYRSEMSVLSGLTLNGGRALGDGPGDHARAVASFLTSAHPYKTGGKDIRNGISVDQVAAQAVGHRTRFASLELGCDPSAQSGQCDSGYSCIYSSCMSWRSPTAPMIKEINPRAVFDRLFGSGNGPQDAATRARRDERRKSVLDFVAEDARDLRGRLGDADQRKLDEYLFAVRQIERRVDESEKLRAPEGPEIDAEFPRPAGTPREYDAHVHLMMDMMVLALASDATRILSFMFTNAGSNRSYPAIGVTSGHHELSHHGRSAEKQAAIARINRHHVGLLAYLLERLRAVKEQDATLLDRSMIVYGSGISDGDRHNHDDLPILLVGRGGGSIKSGQHIRYPAETPLANLYLALLHRMGVENAACGDSTGPLEGLE